MAENEKSRNKTEVLNKSKYRLGIVFIAVVLFLVLGAGWLVSFYVDDRIKVAMERVDRLLPEKVRAAVNNELHANQTENYGKIEAVQAGRKTEWNMDEIDNLDDAIEQIKNQTGRLEEKLVDLRKMLYARSESIREEARQLIGATENRVYDLEQNIEMISRDVKELTESEKEFKCNAQYEIQITYERGSEYIVDHLSEVLRDQGFRITTWPNIRKIDTLYGVSMDSLESKISILPSPGEPVIGDKIAGILREKGGIPMVRTGVDSAANSRPNLVGLLIPPDCSLPADLMKSSAECKRSGRSSG